MFFGFGLEVDFAGFPFLGDLDDDAGHQAKQRGLVGEEADDTGAALDLRVERLAHIGGAQAQATRFGEAESGESFRDVLLGPGGEFGRALLVSFDEFGELGFGMGPVFGVEDTADFSGDLLLEILGGDMSLGVLLEVELAALPGAGVEGGAQCGAEADVGVGGDAVGDADAALLEAGEEVAPVDLGFGEGAGDAEDEAFAIVPADADGDKGGAVSHIAVDADLVVGGVSKQVGDLGQRAVAPFFKLPIQFGGELGDLGGGDVEAAKFTHDGGDAAGADALEIHARDGGFESAVTAAAFLQKGGSEGDVTAADLGCGEVEDTHRGVEAAGFEAVGVAVARLDAFIRAGTDVLGAFHEHGGVHEQFGDFGKSFAEAVLKKEVDEIMMGGSGWLVFVHGCCFLVRTSSNQFWADTTTPGWGGRAAGQADDSATLHRLPDRRTRAS